MKAELDVLDIALQEFGRRTRLTHAQNQNEAQSNEMQSETTESKDTFVALCAGVERIAAAAGGDARNVLARLINAMLCLSSTSVAKTTAALLLVSAKAQTQTQSQIQAQSQKHLFKLDEFVASVSDVSILAPVRKKATIAFHKNAFQVSIDGNVAASIPVVSVVAVAVLPTPSRQKPAHAILVDWNVESVEKNSGITANFTPPLLLSFDDTTAPLSISAAPKFSSVACNLPKAAPKRDALLALLRASFPTFQLHLPETSLFSSSSSGSSKLGLNSCCWVNGLSKMKDGNKNTDKTVSLEIEMIDHGELEAVVAYFKGRGIRVGDPDDSLSTSVVLNDVNEAPNASSNHRKVTFSTTTDSNTNGNNDKNSTDITEDDEDEDDSDFEDKAADGSELEEDYDSEHQTDDDSSSTESDDDDDDDDDEKNEDGSNESVGANDGNFRKRKFFGNNDVKSKKVGQSILINDNDAEVEESEEDVDELEL
ncbi:hypothetical protein HK100_008946 [Physocladia obscura]|uniref:Uncharacterized protein n=1 Tax=Physocladia obscura TaxID=109957 RepID=A0AAD5T676_9FUNG|nr:hypothetical protein HK100_008946 [Physocladia obscura]